MKDKTFERYIRQIVVDNVGVSGQRKILASRVLIIGVGGLGSAVLQQLVGAGVGFITIIDPDFVELHNLNRQTIHSEKTIGWAKVNSAKRYVEDYNTGISLTCVHAKFDVSNASSLIENMDIIVDCTDNFQTRYLINDTCVDFNKPLVHGSILGFEGQVTVFNYKGSADMRAIFPEEPVSVLDCDMLGVLGPLPGMIGNIMAMEVLKIILDLDTLRGKYLVLDALTWDTSILKYSQ